MPAVQVYRGVAKGVLPDEFWQPNSLRFRGGVEYAFLSATRDRDVALSYATSEGSAGIVFEIQQGMLDRGASLRFLSQVGRVTAM